MSDQYLGAVDLSHYHRNNLSCKNCHFSNIDAEGMDLSDGDFSGAIFSNCTFKKCDLAESTFDGCVLDNCWFNECCLEGTSFNDIEGEIVGVSDSHTEGLILTRAQIGNFFLEKSSGRINFAGAYIDGAYFTSVGLWQSDLRGARISGHIKDCDLSECVVDEETCFEDSELSSCALTDLELTKTLDGSKIGIFDGVILPAIRYGREKFISGPGFKILSATESLKEKLKGSASTGYNKSGLSIYSGINYSAQLICSNLDEFRNIK